MNSQSQTIGGEHRSGLFGRRLEIRWTSLAGSSAGRSDGARRTCCIVSIEPGREQDALLECWLLEGDTQRTIMPRQTVSCAVSEEGGRTHLDASLDGRRVLAVTIRNETELQYVQSPLPAEAGLPAGAFDPATMHLRQSCRDAVSA